MKPKRLLRRYVRMVGEEMTVRRGVLLTIGGVVGLGTATVVLPASPFIILLAVIIGAIIGLLML